MANLISLFSFWQITHDSAFELGLFWHGGFFIRKMKFLRSKYWNKSLYCIWTKSKFWMSYEWGLSKSTAEYNFLMLTGDLHSTFYSLTRKTQGPVLPYAEILKFESKSLKLMTQMYFTMIFINNFFYSCHCFRTYVS